MKSMLVLLTIAGLSCSSLAQVLIQPAKPEDFPSVSLQNPPRNWEQFRQGTLKALAAISVLYPDHRVYFLERDAEYLFYLSQFLFDSNDRTRFRLLNVSSRGKESPLLLEYLMANDLGDKERTLLMDSGFLGSVPEAIAESLGGDINKLEAHLLVSRNDSIPSLRVFADAQSIGVHEESLVVKYQNLPHLNNTSIGYASTNGKIVPVTAANQTAEQRRAALALIADLKAYGRRAETRRLFSEMTGLMRRIRNCKESPRCSPDELAELRSRAMSLGVSGFFADVEEFISLRGAWPGNGQTQPQKGLMGSALQKAWRASLLLRSRASIYLRNAYLAKTQHLGYSCHDLFAQL